MEVGVIVRFHGLVDLIKDLVFSPLFVPAIESFEASRPMASSLEWTRRIVPWISRNSSHPGPDSPRAPSPRVRDHEDRNQVPTNRLESDDDPKSITKRSC
jgi:hypothetical protein